MSLLLTRRFVPSWASQFISSFDREVGPVLDFSLSSPLEILSDLSFDQEVGPVLDFPLSSPLEILSILSFDREVCPVLDFPVYLLFCSGSWSRLGLSSQLSSGDVVRLLFDGVVGPSWNFLLALLWRPCPSCLLQPGGWSRLGQFSQLSSGDLVRLVF